MFQPLTRKYRKDRARKYIHVFKTIAHEQYLMFTFFTTHLVHFFYYKIHLLEIVFLLKKRRGKKLSSFHTIDSLKNQ